MLWICGRRLVGCPCGMAGVASNAGRGFEQRNRCARSTEMNEYGLQVVRMLMNN
jgi:hypothetical protein